MRIAFVVHGYAPSIGGAQTYARGLAEALSHQGHDIHVVAPASDDPEAFYELGHRRQGPATETMGGVTVHRLPLLSRRRRFALRRHADAILRSERRSYRARLEGHLEGLRPDAVVALPHLFPNVLAAAGLRDGAPWQLAHVPMLHEHDPNWSIPEVAAIARRADLAIALTTHERDRLQEAYGADRVVVVPPGVVSHPDCPGGSGGPIALFLGRPTPQKGVDTLIAAIEVVQSQMPEAEFVIAGPGAGSLPPGSFRAIEAPDDRERAALIEQARIVVSASRIESFGITTLDAWAHRTPVVVVDTPVNRAVVHHGVDGLLSAGTPAALAETIMVLLKDGERAAALGDAGHRRAAAEFDWSRSAATLSAALA